MNLLFALLDDPATLAPYNGWRRDEYEDLPDLQQDSLSENDCNTKYRAERAILSMDMTGITMSAMHRGELERLLRILDVRKVCSPTLVDVGAELIIRPNLAQGDEMNRASQLGEDIARGNETLLTKRAFAALCDRDDVHFETQEHDDELFPFYRAMPH